MSAATLSDAEVLKMIEKAKRAFPDLSKNGFPQPDLFPQRFTPITNMPFNYDVRSHNSSRLALTNSDSIKEFRSAMAYLNFDGGPVLTDKINYSRTSYGWKHVAEAWAEAHGYHPYVSNGIMICAAHTVGVRIERINANPNVRFNLAKSMEPSRDAFDKTKLSLLHSEPKEYARLDREGYRYGRNKEDWPARRKAA